MGEQCERQTLRAPWIIRFNYTVWGCCSDHLSFLVTFSYFPASLSCTPLGHFSHHPSLPKRKWPQTDLSYRFLYPFSVSNIPLLLSLHPLRMNDIYCIYNGLCPAPESLQRSPFKHTTQRLCSITPDVIPYALFFYLQPPFLSLTSDLNSVYRSCETFSLLIVWEKNSRKRNLSDVREKAFAVI